MTAIVLILTLGYISNGVMLVQISYRSKIIREQQNKEILASVAKWEKKDRRCDYVKSDYWLGPRMEVIYSGSIPYIVTAHYYFLTPFDIGQMGGHGFSERTFGFFVPLKRWKYGVYIH